MPGIVTLVGAGPGDPGLLTVKGRAALAAADTVVFDRLVSPAVLSLIPAGARRIGVGKSASNHPVPQDEINRILLAEAQAGRNVVRLKGGDPFVFGRGGEELEFLFQNGVEFVEIPGVTSAVAAAAYGGIPVTHRDYSSSLHIITGHARAGGELALDFQALARLGGTLVFLMGVAALPAITEGLLNGGMDAATPAAIVENGTMPFQRRCSATLGTLCASAEKMGVQSPAVLVVGGVCALAEKLCWFERLPLHGKRILVTRPRGRSGTLADKLRALGADVAEYPCIETVPIVPCPALDMALEDLASYGWLAFTSAAGVEAFWAGLERRGLDARALGGVKLAAIGTGTAAALNSRGLAPDLVPAVYGAAHLGRALAGADGGKILLLRAEMGSPALTDALTEAGRAFSSIAVYRTACNNPPSQELREEVESGKTSAVTFTSASTVKGFVSAVGADADFSRITGLCIGEQTAREARKYGIPVQVAERAAIDALVELAVKER